MTETKTYTVAESEPGDPEDSLRAISPEGEVFLFTGITVRDVQATVEKFELNRMTPKKCPFEDPKFELAPETPCPICGDLGTLRTLDDGSKCVG